MNRNFTGKSCKLAPWHPARMNAQLGAAYKHPTEAQQATASDAREIAHSRVYAEHYASKGRPETAAKRADEEVSVIQNCKNFGRKPPTEGQIQDAIAVLRASMAKAAADRAEEEAE